MSGKIISKGKTQKNKKYDPKLINPRQLNINTLIKKNIKFIKPNNSINLNSDITFINNILNNNVLQNTDPNTPNAQNIPNAQNMPNIVNNKNKYKYNIVKYLGEGIQGSLYLANDPEKKRYICKKITLDRQNYLNQIKQIEFEINMLKYLSNNKITREYINPCLEHKIIDNNIFTIFPIFDGYSLIHLTKYLNKLDHNSYYKIVFHLIKNILHGMAKLHQYKVAHQNINENSILVSTYTNPKEIYINFTDFGLGCGNSNSMNYESNLINIDKYEKGYNKTNIKFNTCKVNNFLPIKITENIMSELLDSDYLLISQKYDLLCLGIIFIKLLLFFDNINIDLKEGYNKLAIDNILQLLNDKYFSKINEKENANENEKIDYKSLFPYINVNNEVKTDIIEYLKLFKEYILRKTANRKSCQYVLDKIIIYEKYKGEVF